MAIQLVDDYAAADAGGKVDIICRNYPSFLGMLDSRIEGLVYTIETDRACSRHSDRGALGVRVQTSGTSDPTANTGISETMTRDALRTCDFSSGVLEGTENEIDYMYEAYVIRDMRKAYFLFNTQMCILKPKEKALFTSYINGAKDAAEIADELGITQESARLKIHRAKKKVKLSMLHCMQTKDRRDGKCRQEKQVSLM
ncbi:sigma-70 family RNA polymerase sigma factor [Butyrivibrio sp. INlla14]|uniref:sigma-70 family RNA polymerase sigma factor n=1 Tax=Butyrivibrio sp. INlla14 TaxID=1520808 RepID=UPI0008766D57|nr:sigma-70 family RNA polymerase sigma factor [Butyrivibrio sp. INlla14]SCY16051.1 hypothetical protein SAMN02910371_01285 [Butyrivibrio sp. INlla14]